MKGFVDNWQELFTQMFESIHEYLNWQQSFKEQGGVNITNRYLYFGKDSEPDCFDFKTLTKMSNELQSGRRRSCGTGQDALRLLRRIHRSK